VPSRIACQRATNIGIRRSNSVQSASSPEVAGSWRACAIRNTTYFEVLLQHGAHKYALLEDIEIGRDGLARCPHVPGIGAQIDFDLIKRQQMALLT
jgi:hypothetical protein